MTAYRQFWALTALISIAVIYAVQGGILAWGLTKFPEVPIQLAFGFITAVFLWCYFTIGYSYVERLRARES